MSRLIPWDNEDLLPFPSISYLFYIVVTSCSENRFIKSFPASLTKGSPSVYEREANLPFLKRGIERDFFWIRG
jgi:hypothetical protein